jgi:hypothetical protein
MGQARLNPAWAKLEILIGLGAAAVGTKLPSDYATLGIALMALGGYLAMAGHRSHLYQSQNRQTAYLLQLMKRE